MIHQDWRKLMLPTVQEQDHLDFTIVQAIENLFQFLGRLTLAEYLQAGTFDSHLNRYILARLDRYVLLGHWFQIGRRIQESFKKSDKIWFLPELAHFNWGTPDYAQHICNQLLEFRNRFFHTTYAMPISATQNTLLLLQTIFDSLDWLEQYPLCSRNQIDQIINIHQATATDLPLSQPFHPWIKGVHGWIPLFPLFEINPDLPYSLQAASWQANLPQAKLNWPSLQTAIEHFEAEKSGRFVFNWSGSSNTVTELLNQLSPDFQTNLASICLNYYPGVHLSALVQACQRVLSNNSQTLTLTYRVSPEDLTQSGLHLVRYLYFHLEQQQSELEIKSRLKLSELWSSIENLKTYLFDNQKHLQLIITGIESASSNEFDSRLPTVLEVLNKLQHSHIRLILLKLHQSSQQGGSSLPVSQELCVRPTPFSQIDFIQFAQQLLKDPLRRNILSGLLHSEQGLSLFELCDWLEIQYQTPLFTPQVEASLHSVLPLLKIKSSVQGNIYSLLDPSYRDTLQVLIK